MSDLIIEELQSLDELGHGAMVFAGNQHLVDAELTVKQLRNFPFRYSIEPTPSAFRH